MEARDRALPIWFTQIEMGALRLPRFQRFESWSHTTITSLLDTVLRGLPAGATLILAVGDEEKFKSRSVEGAPSHPHKPTEHLLDGQQRLTAVWKAFHDLYDDRTYFIYFGDEDGSSVPHAHGQSRWTTKSGNPRPAWVEKPDKTYERGYIPLRLLRPGEHAQEISAWCRAAAPSDLETAFDVERNIQQLRQKIVTYNIPFLELPATTPRDVALDVFIKMNTSFTRLTTFDILVAQFEEETGESLQDLVAKVRESVPMLEFYVRPNEVILEVATLREDRAPSQANQMRLDLGRLFIEWDAITGGLDFTTAFLEEERVFDGERLPTVAVIRVIAALHQYLPQDPDGLGNARRLLRKYLWRSFFTTRYERAAGSASLQDYRALRGVLKEEQSESSVPIFDEAQFPLPTVEELMVARWPKTRDILARGVLALTLRDGARDIADDAPVSRDQLPNREYHHLFPRAVLEREGDLAPWEINRALNCALLTWNTNRKISAKDPIEYLRERVERAPLGEQDIRDRLATHVVPYDALAVGDYGAISNAEERRAAVTHDYHNFLLRRAEMIEVSMRALCEGKQP